MPVLLAFLAMSQILKKGDNVMSIPLVILGLLMEGDKHPYQIQQIVNERQMKYYIKMAHGSLYYAFDQLEKKEYVEIVDVIKDTNRPDKTIYRITEAGKKEFEQLLMKQLEKKEHMQRPIYAALTFTSYADSEDVLHVLEKKREEASSLLKKMEWLYARKEKEEEIAKLYIVIRVIMHLKAEITWLEHLIEETKQGRLQHKDLPMLSTSLFGENS